VAKSCGTSILTPSRSYSFLSFFFSSLFSSLFSLPHVSPRYACKMNYDSGAITRLKDKAPSLLDMVKSFPSKVVDKFVQVGRGRRRGRGEKRKNREKKNSPNYIKIIVPQHELNKEYVQKYLVTKIAEQTNSKQEKIDVHDDVRTYGFDSIRQMQLIRELEDR
jgi:hypothetical protein